MSDLPELRFLDEAARAAGYPNWEVAHSGLPNGSALQWSIIAHARTLQKLAELEAENAPKYASECGEAAQAYIRELWGYERYARNMNTLPATFRWYECFDRMVAAARPLPSPPKGDVACPQN